MSIESHPDIPMWIQGRIVAFFNKARNVGDVLDGTIKDDPANGPGKTIGPTLAARILREKSKYNNRRFSDLKQIDDVRGVGPDTMRDFVYSFGTNADQFFQDSMYDNGVIYRENWPLEFFRYTIDDKEEFETIANDQEKIREIVAAQVAKVSDEKGVSEENRDLMVADVNTAYMDYYHNSTQIAGYAFAVYFYDFDADNWFSWERIQEQTLGYFDFNMNVYPWFMELYLFRGFTNRGIISPGISPDALPVVVNHAEQTITFWITALYD